MVLLAVLVSFLYFMKFLQAIDCWYIALMTSFSLIADAHVGPEKPYEGLVRKLSRHSLDYLSQLACDIDQKKSLDFAVQLGDLIEDCDDALIDADNFRLGQAALAGGKPLLNVIGNHDQVNLNESQLCRLAGLSRLYYAQDIGDLHCVVLFSSSRAHTDIHIDPVQRLWLAADLAAATKPAVVFLHHPIDEQSLQGNVWFERYPDYCFVEEREEVRQILSASGKVFAVFTGHVHQNSLSTIDGIHYVTIQSLVERVAEPEKASRAHAVVHVDSAAARMTVDVAGFDAASYDLPLLRSVT